jgi:murein DD-endopeptidase MepM/ murein hydrolase activator NlpD
MSSKTKHHLSQHRSRIFFRNPALLKIVAWLGSLSFIGNTGVVWADFQPISTAPSQAQAIAQASGAARTNAKIGSQDRQVFGPYLPKSTSPEQLRQKQSNPNREIPVSIDPSSVSVSPTGNITLPKTVDIPLAQNYTVKVKGDEISIEILVPPPLQNTIPANRQLATKTVPQVQDRISNSTPKTGLSVAVTPGESKSNLPTANPLEASLPKGGQRALKANIVAPMKPSVIANRWRSLSERESSNPIPSSLTAEVEVPVPLPRQQIVKVQPVAQLPEVKIGKTVPTVPPLPTVNDRADAAQFKPIAFISNASSEQNVEIIYPVSTPAPITSGYGWRTHPITGNRRFHAGVDIGAPMGAPVVAAGSGTIVSAGWMGGYGKTITIQHNGVQQTLYGHLSEIFVQEGQKIQQGTVIGRVGSTGNSTGPHLHFENRMSTSDGWVAVDPGDEMKYALNNLRRDIDVARKDLSPKIN